METLSYDHILWVEKNDFERVNDIYRSLMLIEIFSRFEMGFLDHRYGFFSVNVWEQKYLTLTAGKLALM